MLSLGPPLVHVPKMKVNYQDLSALSFFWSVVLVQSTVQQPFKRNRILVSPAPLNIPKCFRRFPLQWNFAFCSLLI